MCDMLRRAEVFSFASCLCVDRFKCVACVFMHKYEVQRTFTVIPQFLILHSVTGSLIALETTKQGKLAGYQVPGIHLSLPPEL